MKKIIFGLLVLAGSVFGFESAELSMNSIIIKNDGYVTSVFKLNDISYLTTTADKTYLIVLKAPNSTSIVTKDRQVFEYIANAFARH